MTSAHYIFREAQINDIPAMKHIRDSVRENTLVSGTIEVADYEKALFQDGKGWVCLYHNAVIGFSCGRLRQADVWALFIDQRHEGMGIGNQLMEFLEHWMFANNCPEIKLSTEPGTRAERLYRRRQWVSVGLLPNQELEFRLRRPHRGGA